MISQRFSFLLTGKKCGQSIDSQPRRRIRLWQCILDGEVRDQVHCKDLLLEVRLTEQLWSKVQADVHGGNSWHRHTQ